VRAAPADELGMDRVPRKHEPLLFTPDEVAELLSVCRYTVYRLIEQGDLPSVCIGRLRRVRKVDLERWIEEHLSTASEAPSARRAGGARRPAVPVPPALAPSRRLVRPTGASPVVPGRPAPPSPQAAARAPEAPSARRRAAARSPTKRGWGTSGRLLNSGWPWVPR